MKRDGAMNSLWQQGMEDFQSAAQEIKTRFYDIIIVGGGVTGVTTALQLQKSGKKCLLLEAHSLCFGTTGGTTAHLNSFFDTSYEEIRSNFGEDAIHLVANATSRALDLYHHNIEHYGIECEYEQKDGYVYSRDQKQTVQLSKIFEASKQAGVDVAYTERIPVPVDFHQAIVYRDQAQVHPTKYVMALAREFEKAGGVIHQQCRVEDTVEADDRVTANTSLGAFQATFLIYATHIPPHINLLHFRCAPYRSYALAVKLNGNYPDGLSNDMYDPYHYYRTQIVNGEKYFIVGGEDHKTGHEENTEMCFRKLEAHAREYFDVKEVVHKWSSQYFEPSDGLAYIGLLPGSKGNILVATGFSGNGMTYSHIAALLLPDLINKKENAWAALFNPNRLKPIAGFAEFIKENADVVGQFIAKRIGTDKISELAEMAPGEGRLVKFEGNRLAIYKDENGKLFALNPVCTHAKCIVDWNTAEKSWDCPCHGGRFDIDGKVITGPAHKPLEVVQVMDLVK
ncbi:MAG: FAD-dependent oxidoreductase [Flavisolibacter sp.]|jgi:glycine/D-amino acid oxidase-like deaminating enzyme/nitrite reductase/ring-hydroxylating ferredoxin subunit|nr:FAD-dependent oxidoreductase [Flavisolibacter sp.]